MSNLVLFLLALFATGGLAVETRHDDNWPPAEIVEALNPIAKLCRKKTGVSDEAIRQFTEGTIHDDPVLKCYMYCLFVEGKAVDENGEVHLELLQVHIEELDKEIQNIAINIAKKCLNPKGDTLCERAWWYHQCWKSSDPKHYFLL